MDRPNGIVELALEFGQNGVRGVSIAVFVDAATIAVATATKPLDQTSQAIVTCDSW